MPESQIDHPALFIITGERGAGKTTFCRAIVASANAKQLTIAGIVSEPVFEGGQKIAIDAVAPATNQRKRLAVRRTTPAANPNALGWLFDSDALAWGNTVFSLAAACDIFIVDELGPLELKQNRGWQAGLSALDAGNYRFGIVVIRPELLALAQRRWRHAKTINIRTPQQARQTAQQIIHSISHSFK